MKRRELLKQGLAGAAGLAAASVPGVGSDAQAAKRRPNVIVFHTDDQNFDSINYYGYTGLNGYNVLTPNTDALAAGGVCFDRGYTTTGVCVASRYALVTGMFPSRCTSKEYTTTFKGKCSEPSFNTYFDGGENNIASVMKSAGYKTGFVGKWHLGGYDRSKAKKLEGTKFWAGAWRAGDDDVDPTDPEVQAIMKFNNDLEADAIKKMGFDYTGAVTRNPEGFRSRALNYHNPEFITEKALEFIEDSGDEPFFLYLNHTLHHIPHPQESLLNGDPRMTHEGYLDKAPDCMPSRKEVYDKVVDAGYPPESAWITWMDEALGAVMDKLGKQGITDDTMIIYVADNNVPAKGTIYEDGVNVPFIIRYPREIPGGQRSSALIQNLDIAPTAFDLAGVTPPEDMILDGESAMPFLRGESDRIHDELFFEIGWTRAVCTDRWKYLALRHPEADLAERKKNGGLLYHNRTLKPHQHNALLWHPSFMEPDQLYDLSIDHSEVVDYSHTGEYNHVMQDLQGRMKKWLQTFDYPFGEFKTM